MSNDRHNKNEKSIIEFFLKPVDELFENDKDSKNLLEPIEHLETILSGLNRLKLDKILCDITLTAEDKKFQVHKAILASCSDYFRSMFTSGMKECSLAEIELKGVTSRGLDKVIQIIYNSSASVDCENDLFEFISAANHLQCQLAINYCKKILFSLMNFQNYYFCLQVAKIFRWTDIEQKIDFFILENLQDIIDYQCEVLSSRKLRTNSSSDSMYEINIEAVEEAHESNFEFLSYEQLTRCLSSDQIRLKEIDLFLLVWKWIRCNLLSQEDISHQKSLKILKNKEKSTNKVVIIRSLMRQIRFGLISPFDLVNRVQPIHRLMSTDKVLRNFVLQALNYHVLPSIKYSNVSLNDSSESDCDSGHGEQNTLYETNLRMRSTVASILLIGGREINSDSPSLHSGMYLFQIISEKSFPNSNIKPDFPNLPNGLSHMQVVVLSNHFLYVLGGCISQCLHGESAVNTVYRYDPRLNEWRLVSSMKEKRAYFGACILSTPIVKKYCHRNLESSEHIYSIGGKNREGALANVEKYDPIENKWENVKELPLSLYAHSTSILNNTIYVSGGYSNNSFIPNLFKFSVKKNEWERARSMNIPRGWHSMCAAKERLYVFGGCNLNNLTNQIHMSYNNILQFQTAQPVIETEFYTPSTDQWTIVKPIINDHKEAVSIYLNNFIYVIGGYDIIKKTAQKAISIYDPENNEWNNNETQLPKGKTGIGCCKINIPEIMHTNMK